jgi:MIZ/SP-RING zinc finger
MQQQNNNPQPTPQELLIAKRLAESNATTHHFLGATRRPWMTNTVLIPSIPAERHPLRSQPSRVTRIIPSTQEPVESETLEYTTRSPECQPLGSENSQSSACDGISAIAGRLTASRSSNDAARKRSFDVAGSELDTQQRRVVFQQTHQPGLNSLVPSSEAAPPAVGLPDLRSLSMHRARMMIVSIIRRLNDFETRNGGLSKLESSRFSLLKGACHQNDLFYLFTHQAFCATFLDPGQITETGFGKDQYTGLNLLNLILLHNQDLSAEVLNLFADLPAPLRILFKEPIIYRSVMVQVGVFLRRFAAGWDPLRERCLARRSPPFVVELVDVFEVHSPVMQKVLFNSIHRQIGSTENPAWNEQGLTLFDADQAQYQARRRNHGNAEPRPQAAILVEQRLLAEQYKALWKQANNLTVHSAPLEHTMTFIQPNPSSLTMSQNQDTHSALSVRRASASLPYDPISQQCRGHAQWSPVQNPLSQSQSANTLRINTTSSSPTDGPYSASRIQQLSSPMHLPSFVQHSSPRAVRRSPNHLAGHAGQQPRRGRPPLSDRPVFLPTPALLSQRGGRGSHGGGAAHVGSHSPTDQMRTNFPPFIPPFGYQPIQTSTPDPNSIVLHQAYLRSPAPKKINAVGQRVPEIRLYQYLKSFVFPPKAIEPWNSFLSWEFVTTTSEFQKTATGVTASDGRSKRPFSDGSILYRLRSVEVAHSLHTIEEGEWNVKETSWPSSCFVKINDINIEIRRKLHHGKDLPVDLTLHVREGKNNITIAILHGREEKTAKRYAMAVEVLEVGDQARIDSAPSMLAANESLSSIIQGLARSHDSTTEDDDEIRIVDSHLSIDLLDPFMATIFDIPARGKTCTHRECFDLRTFFQTRKSRVKDGPTSPDEWKCPICKKDARPQRLVVDCFLKTVRDFLVTSGTATDARAILICSDGGWDIKREGGDTTRTREDSNATAADSPAMRGTVTGNHSSSASAVIEIDDD